MPKKKPQAEPLPPPSPSVADTMEQAAAMSGLPSHVLRWAKKSGCPAFRGSRVHIVELRAWLESNRPLISADGGELMDKERADVLLKLERLEGEKIANAKSRGELQPIKDICDKLRAINEEIKLTLKMRLLDQLPAHNAGLDAPKQRENNRAAFAEICSRFQGWAREYFEKEKEQIKREREKKQSTETVKV